jgi:DNA helicase II / ATP-dependent DNA helicase PcrA
MLEESYLTRILSNYRLSATALNKYLDCPIAFYYENIIRVPKARNENMGFGNAVHYALEMLFKNIIDNKLPSEDEFINYFKEGIARNASHFTDKQKARRLEYGKEILPKYYQKYAADSIKKVKLEHHVQTTIAGVPVSGVFDKIEMIDNLTVNVVDYKTGDPERAKSKLGEPSEKEPFGGDYWRQLAFYKLLIDNDKHNWRMQKGIIDFVQPNKKTEEFSKEERIITPPQAELVTNLIKETHQKIINKEFKDGCGDEECSWCNFTKYLKKEDNLSNQVTFSIEED